MVDLSGNDPPDPKATDTAGSWRPSDVPSREAVSYTHLDVYKRQAEWFPAFSHCRSNQHPPDPPAQEQAATLKLLEPLAGKEAKSYEPVIAAIEMCIRDRFTTPSSSQSVSLTERKLLNTDEVRRVKRPYQIITLSLIHISPLFTPASRIKYAGS